MNVEDIRQNMRSGLATIGTWAQLPCPDCARILAQGGFDWVAADLEHGAFTRAILPDFFRAVESGGAIPFARLAEPLRKDIKAALDSGAKGLIFPMIETREQLDAAIGWCLYPDYGGSRGVGYCVANDFGQTFDAYREGDAGELLLVAQIEHIRAVDNLDDILSHPRLDAIMVGPYDLSGSLGMTGQLNAEPVQKTLRTIAAKAKAHGVPMGLHVVRSDPDEVRRRVEEGYLFMAYGIDTVFLWENAKRPVSAKREQTR